MYSSRIFKHQQEELETFLFEMQTEIFASLHESVCCSFWENAEDHKMTNKIMTVANTVINKGYQIGPLLLGVEITISWENGT